jgi:hypothetical protein
LAYRGVVCAATGTEASAAAVATTMAMQRIMYSMSG